ncbi:hypothetical protein [Salinicoccus roseus]|uniref:hypothetical protein n=1 Tax=Salinicoccus roseus TaxID=45670 RepID=UPI003DA19A43
MRKKQHLKIISWITLIIFVDVILFSFLPDSNGLEILFSFCIIMLVGGAGAYLILRIYD